MRVLGLTWLLLVLIGVAAISGAENSPSPAPKRGKGHREQPTPTPYFNLFAKHPPPPPGPPAPPPGEKSEARKRYLAKDQEEQDEIWLSTVSKAWESMKADSLNEATLQRLSKTKECYDFQQRFGIDLLKPVLDSGILQVRNHANMERVLIRTSVSGLHSAVNPAVSWFTICQSTQAETSAGKGNVFVPISSRTSTAAQTFGMPKQQSQPTLYEFDVSFPNKGLRKWTLCEKIPPNLRSHFSNQAEICQVHKLMTDVAVKYKSIVYPAEFREGETQGGIRCDCHSGKGSGVMGYSLMNSVCDTVLDKPPPRLDSRFGSGLPKLTLTKYKHVRCRSFEYQAHLDATCTKHRKYLQVCKDYDHKLSKDGQGPRDPHQNPCRFGNSNFKSGGEVFSVCSDAAQEVVKMAMKML